MPSACSFCGEFESDTRKVIGGRVRSNGDQVASAFICSECIALASEIVARPAAESLAMWHAFIYQGTQFEWGVGPPSNDGKLLVLREVATGRSTGVILENDEEPSTEIALRALDKMLDHLA